MRLAQSGLGLAPCRNIDKGHHGPLHHTRFDDGVRRILHRERRAVGAPEMLGVDTAWQALPESVENRAQVLWVMHAAQRTVGMGVVCQRVHVQPQHVSRCQAQLLGAGTVDERAATLQVDAENPFPGGLQQLR